MPEEQREELLDTMLKSIGPQRAILMVKVGDVWKAYVVPNTPEAVRRRLAEHESN